MEIDILHVDLCKWKTINETNNHSDDVIAKASSHTDTPIASKYNLNFNWNTRWMRPRHTKQRSSAKWANDVAALLQSAFLENVHTNLSGVRICQRRYQNEIIFYHFPFSRNESNVLLFTYSSYSFFLFSCVHHGQTKPNRTDVWMHVALFLPLCVLTNVLYALQHVYTLAKCCSQIKIYSIEECFQQFSVQRLWI